jgi:hypothetical protein
LLRSEKSFLSASALRCPLLAAPVQQSRANHPRLRHRTHDDNAPAARKITPS